MNKKFFTGMAVLLIASLFFLGCGGDDSEEENNSNNSTAKWYDGLGSGLNEAADGSVTLTATTTPLSAEVTVPTGKTLVIDTGKTLAIGSGGSLAGEPASGSTAAAAVVIKGTVTGGTNFYAAGTVLPADAVAAGVYAWDAAADGGSTAGWKQTALDVHQSYILKESEAANADAAESGLILDSALKNTATGLVTIKLRGTFEPEYLYTGHGIKGVDGNYDNSTWDDDTWTDGTNYRPATGKYGAVYINGFFPQAKTNVGIQIRPYPALVFYTGGSELLQAAATAGPTTNSANLYVAASGDNHQKWKLYTQEADTNRDPARSFGVLLFSEAGTKTVTLDIDEWAGNTTESGKVGDLLNVTIDYTDVIFPETLQDVTYTLKEGEGTDAGPAASGISIASAKKNTVTDWVTIKLAGTFGAPYLYTGHGTTGVVGNYDSSKWDVDTWTNGVNYSPAEGKYGAVYINGFFPQAKSNVGIQIRPYPALVFYTGGGELLTNALTGPTTNSANLYVAASGDNHQKWKLYDTPHFAQNETFGVLLYSAATDKIVTLDIDEYSEYTNTATRTGDILTVTIDYADVVWTGS
jgi:hypothetical protein